MTALATNVSREWRDGMDVILPVAANANIRQGAMVEYDAAGRVAPAAKGTSAELYAGVALAPADNTGGGAGVINVMVRRAGTFRFGKTGTAVAGKLAQLEDDNTVTDDATGREPCGVIVAAAGDDVWVDITRRVA